MTKLWAATLLVLHEQHWACGLAVLCCSSCKCRNVVAVACWKAIHVLLCSERRNAASALDYALVSGVDGAPKAKAAIDATIKRTGDEVRLEC